MKKFALLAFTSVMLSGAAGARTWTSVDGTKTFEGDFVSCDQKTITVKRGLRPMTFKIELVSEEDQKWARAENKRRATAQENKEAIAEFARSEFGKALGKLRKLEGKTFEDHEWDQVPEFFILSYSASSCATCRAKASQLAATYQKIIAENAKLEFIHLSFDNNEEAALKWATSFKQPWPILTREEIDENELITPFFPDGQLSLPTYILVDRNGKEIARGLDAALAAASKRES